jgi:hypothetical protein
MYKITCGTVVVAAGIELSVRLVTAFKVLGSIPEDGDIVHKRRGSTQPPAHLVPSLFPGVKAA